ncbi:hypothetical protein DUI87_20846 [Hirundo rustica rustica]|uniref:RNase H type-1 domain-containing protein n=1 Tax=Hirundo rustica rustica TaxID=333673 RepID=A0A3M0JNB3_HIRRU|nr:hypothetical protein DUI87_20846 [Hirundo rustica rustica]
MRRGLTELIEQAASDSGDLKDAFFCLPIHEDSQKIFAFEWENPKSGRKSQLIWFLKYQAIMAEQDDVEILVTNIINPASFLSGSQGEPVHHDCLETIEVSYSSRPDLKDAPLDDAETWFTDGSSYVISGKRHAGYAVTTCRKVIESGPLPTDTSAQKAEIIALVRALEIAKGNKVNIYTDPRYAFGVVHAHGAIWKERGLLNSQGKNIKHSQEILRLLEAVQLPEQVAIMHIKAHQKVSSKLEEGNELADREAKEAAKGEITIEGALIPDGQVSLEVREEHQKTHWGIEALYNYLIEKITARNLYSTVIQDIIRGLDNIVTKASTLQGQNEKRFNRNIRNRIGGLKWNRFRNINEQISHCHK